MLYNEIYDDCGRKKVFPAATVGATDPRAYLGLVADAMEKKCGRHGMTTMYELGSSTIVSLQACLAIISRR